MLSRQQLFQGHFIGTDWLVWHEQHRQGGGRSLFLAHGLEQHLRGLSQLCLGRVDQPLVRVAGLRVNPCHDLLPSPAQLQLLLLTVRPCDTCGDRLLLDLVNQVRRHPKEAAEAAWLA